MKKLFLIPLICCFTLFSCGSDDSNPAPAGDDDGGIPVTATYRITFTPDFTQVNFPDDYPTDPTFSGIFVAVHAPDKSVFAVGSQASDGLKVLAEDGDSAALNTELGLQGSDDENDFILFSLSPAAGPTTSQSIEITINPEKTSFTFLSSLSPSPDWFVGVRGYSLIDSPNTLVVMDEAQVVAYDAGTDSGTTYAAANDPTTPAQPITVIDGPPLVPSTGIGAAIGKIVIERTDI